MKLKLDTVRDINILQALGSVTPENFAVLRAGIKKLLASGKNKIILDLPDAAGFEQPVLKEISVLNALASELSGQILLSSINAEAKKKIEELSKPISMNCFSDREKAIEFFYPKNATGASPAPVAQPAASTPAAATTPTAAAAPAPADEEKEKLLKRDIRAKEIGDLGEARKRISELETENLELKQRISETVLIRREPPDVGAWREKTEKLEKDLAEAIKTAQDAAGAKK